MLHNIKTIRIHCSFGFKLAQAISLTHAPEKSKSYAHECQSKLTPWLNHFQYTQLACAKLHTSSTKIVYNCFSLSHVRGGTSSSSSRRTNSMKDEKKRKMMNRLYRIAFGSSRVVLNTRYNLFLCVFFLEKLHLDWLDWLLRCLCVRVCIGHVFWQWWWCLFVHEEQMGKQLLFCFVLWLLLLFHFIRLCKQEN